MSHSIEMWDALREHSRGFSARPAVRMADATLTFAELFATAERAARVLRRAGVAERSYVVFAAPNSLGFVPALLALWRLSATVGLFSPLNGPSELLAVADETRPSGYLVPTALAKSWGPALGARAHELEVDIAGASFSFLFPRATDGNEVAADAALIKYTSGSTGRPKGIALTADNLLAEAEAVIKTLGITPADAILAPVPLCHSYGFDLGGLAMLRSGATLVPSDVFVARRVIADLAEGRCSIFLGVPTMYRMLVDTRLASAPSLSAARYLLSCTAPLSPSLIAAFHDRFDAAICQHYGSSEAGAVTTHLPSAVLGRPDSVGQAMQNVTLAISDLSGLEVARGLEGEVVVSGPAVARRYVMGAAHDRPLGDGTFRMGDLGVIDTDGFLYLRGRMDQMINVGGFKVSPVEVAQVLEKYPPVNEAAVIGASDGHGEEVVYAAVTLRLAATETEIIAFCRSQLADYKVPRRIDIRDELPRGPTGKIRLRPKDVRL
ncbi:MAG: AMP-binding protein [Chloroflexota bacterium]